MSIDWASIEQTLNSERTCYDYEKYKNHFRKVAFDVYKTDASEQLWELRTADDGRQYLYALYSEPEDIVASSKTEFQASADHKGENVTLAYKQVPIFRFASSEYKFTPEQASAFAEFVSDKAKDRKWIDALMSEAMSEERRKVVSKLLSGEG